MRPPPAAHSTTGANTPLRWSIASLLPTYTPQIRSSLSTRLTAARLKLPTIKVDWAVDPNPRLNYDPRKLALIVEPRPLPHLTPHLLHMMSVVPPDWRFLLVGSPRSVLSVSRAPAILHRQMTGKLDLMVLPEPWGIDGKEDVYRLMTDQRFYDEFLPGVEWILKFESDAILCANSEESLNDWLDWSWAGAPRYDVPFPLASPSSPPSLLSLAHSPLTTPSTKNDRYSGNGGLTLRRVSAIRRVLSFQARRNDSEPEDEWFGKRLLSLPSERVTSSSDPIFTVEDIYHERPMGYHVRGGGGEGMADAVWKDRERRRGIFEYCPELGLVMDMKLEVERCEGDNGQGGIGPTDKEIKEEKKKEEERKKLEAEEIQRIEDEEKAREEGEGGSSDAYATPATSKDTTDSKDGEGQESTLGGISR